MTYWDMIYADAMLTMKSLPTGWARVVCTDPPYNEVNEQGEDDSTLRQVANIGKSFADSQPVHIPTVAHELARVSHGGSVYVWCGYEQISEWVREFRALDLCLIRIGVWTKTNPSPANAQHGWLADKEFFVFAKHRGAPYHRGYASLDFREPVYMVEGWEGLPAKHPRVLRKLIEASALPGENILDPFMGSGTTGVACGDEYNFLGVDNSPQAHLVATRQINDHLGLSKYTRAQVPWWQWRLNEYE